MKLRKSDPSAPLVGSVALPGDKSISHRALILAALARGRSHITNLNVGGDVLCTAGCLAHLGPTLDVDEGNAEVKVESFGRERLAEPEGILWAGNSGTTLRILAGVCAGIEGLSVLDGDVSLRSRPMLRVVSPLRQMGADVDGRSHGDRAPLVVRGRRLHGIDLELPVASAQVKSAVLLAGLGADGKTSVVEPRPSRDHTERMLRFAGVDVAEIEGGAAVTGGQEVRPARWRVPGDPSSAAFLVVAALLLPGSDLEIAGVSLNATRTGYLDVLKRMGARIETQVDGESSGEPVGTVRSRSSDLHGTGILSDEVPALIDELPVLAVAAARAEGETTITGAQELRLKESDRVQAMVDGLGALGADVEALPDGMIIRGPASLSGTEVESNNDHRVALALAVAGLVTDGNVKVRGWSCINTSFPEFLDVLAEARGDKR